MPCELNINIAGQDFVVCAERALYWKNLKALLVADVHLGKSDIFRISGIAVPQAVQYEDIERLDRLLSRLQPERLIVLGDMVHGRYLADETLDLWKALRSKHSGTRFILTQGNHDRFSGTSQTLVDDILPDLVINNIILSHDHAKSDLYDLNIMGHIHPIYRDRIFKKALPAMVLKDKLLILPAFSEFTAGVKCNSSTDQVWVFVEFQEVFKLL